MKVIILFLFMITTLVRAEDLDFDQKKVVFEFLDFMNGVKDKNCPEIEIKSYKAKGNEYLSSSDKKILEKSEFDKLEKLSQSVLIMQTKDQDAKTDSKGNKIIPFGSAFHIGSNLVLTNLHVLDGTLKNLTKCGTFQLKDARTKQQMFCKKVHYCQADIDVCLIEMKQIKDIPSLKLKANPIISEADRKTKELTVIGNPLGRGLKISRGKGITPAGNSYFLNTPVTVGNSGGPLLDGEGSVLGIIRRQGKSDKDGNPVQKINDKYVKEPAYLYSIATSSQALIDAIRKGLTKDPETLEKFNEAVSE